MVGVGVGVGVVVGVGVGGGVGLADGVGVVVVDALAEGEGEGDPGLGLVAGLVRVGEGPDEELKGAGAVGLEVAKATISPEVASRASATGSLEVGARLSRESTRFWLDRR